MTILGLGLICWLVGAQVKECQHFKCLTRGSGPDAVSEIRHCGCLEPSSGTPHPQLEIDQIPSISEAAASSSLMNLHLKIQEARRPRNVPNWLLPQRDAAHSAGPSATRPTSPQR